MFVAVSRAQTKIAPELIRLLVFRLASGGAEGRHSLTESHHDGVCLRGHGNLIIHSAIRSVPKTPLGVEASHWLYLLHHGIVICQGHPDSSAGLQALVNTTQTKAQDSGWPA